MLYPAELLETIERLENVSIDDVVYRHMLGDISPARPRVNALAARSQASAETV